MKIAIVTDSTCDWHVEDYAERNVTMVPLKILVASKEYLDQVNLTPEQFYDLMEQSEELPKSSQPSPGDFSQVYERLAQEGYDAILSIHIAAKLSGTLSSAEMAAANAPIPVHTVDSLVTSSALGLVVAKACELRDEGLDFEDLCKRIEAYSDAAYLYLAPAKLENLVKGGRFTEEQAAGIALLNVRLILVCDENGSLVLSDKVKGSKGVIKAYTSILEEAAKEHGALDVRIMHARNRGEVDKLLKSIEEAGIEVNIQSIDICGATIATHTGTGVLALAYAPASA